MAVDIHHLKALTPSAGMPLEIQRVGDVVMLEAAVASLMVDQEYPHPKKAYAMKGV